MELLTGLHIPDLKHIVLAPAHDAFAIGAEGDAQDNVGVPREGAYLLTGLRITDLERPVLASADDPFAMTSALRNCISSAQKKREQIAALRAQAEQFLA
jgi:hypothetical protein